MDPFGELKKLHELHQCGAVSAAEYDVMKSALLPRLLQATAPLPAPALPPATSPEANPAPADRELNATNDGPMTALGYITCPFSCIGTIFAIANIARGNVHGPIQLVLNIFPWVIVAVVFAATHK